MLSGKTETPENSKSNPGQGHQELPTVTERNLTTEESVCPMHDIYSKKAAKFITTAFGFTWYNSHWIKCVDVCLELPHACEVNFLGLIGNRDRGLATMICLGSPKGIL